MSDESKSLPTVATRLSLDAAFVQRLIDTASVMEGEVTYLRLKAVFHATEQEGASEGEVPPAGNSQHPQGDRI